MPAPALTDLEAAAQGGQWCHFCCLGLPDYLRLTESSVVAAESVLSGHAAALATADALVAGAGC